MYEITQVFIYALKWNIPFTAILMKLAFAQGLEVETSSTELKWNASENMEYTIRNLLTHCSKVWLSLCPFSRDSRLPSKLYK
jgi:hypothetical protein